MTDDIAPQSGDAAATPADAEPAEVVADTRTVEEVTAEWSNRMSARDRAHNASEEALRAERDAIAAERDALKTSQVAKAQGDMTDADRIAAERDALRDELAAERAARQVAEKMTKYPKTAAELPSEVFTVLDEGKLAALETKFSAEPVTPSRQDPNAAPRKGAPADKANPTAEDLRADLARYGPDFAAQLRG